MPVGDSEQVGSYERGIGLSVTIWWGSCVRVQSALGHCFLASSGSVESSVQFGRSVVTILTTVQFSFNPFSLHYVTIKKLNTSMI